MTEKEVENQVNVMDEIQADIARVEDEDLREKAEEEYLKPETFVKTDPLVVKDFLGLPYKKEEKKWLSLAEIREKVRSKIHRLPEFDRIEGDEKEKVVKVSYREKK